MQHLADITTLPGQDIPAEVSVPAQANEASPQGPSMLRT